MPIPETDSSDTDICYSQFCHKTIEWKMRQQISSNLLVIRNVINVGASRPALINRQEAGLMCSASQQVLAGKSNQNG